MIPTIRRGTSRTAGERRQALLNQVVMAGESAHAAGNNLSVPLAQLANASEEALAAMNVLLGAPPQPSPPSPQPTLRRTHGTHGPGSMV